MLNLQRLRQRITELGVQLTDAKKNQIFIEISFELLHIKYRGVKSKQYEVLKPICEEFN